MDLNVRKLVAEVRDVCEFPNNVDKSKDKAWVAVRAIFQTITEALRRGETVQIPHLGKFYLLKTKPKRCSANLYGNLGQSLSIITVPSKTCVKFKPSSGIIRDLNGTDNRPEATQESL